MNIEKEMTKLANSLKPSSMQEERVLKRVLEAQNKPNLLQLFKMKRFNLKFITGASLMLLVLLGLPTIVQLSGIDSKVNQQIAHFKLAGDQRNVNIANERDGLADFGQQPTGSIVDGYDEDTDTSNDDRAKENIAAIKISTDTTKDIYDKVKSLVNDFGGYVVRSSYHSGEGQISNIEIRVPVEKFEDVLSKIREFNANIVSEDIETLDRQNILTESNSDLEAKEEELKNLEGKLAQTQNQTEKNTLNYQISTLKSQIKTLKSTIQSINIETNFSTIKVEISKGESNNIGVDLLPTIKYTVTFWATILIWIIVPVLFTLPVWLPIFILVKRKLKNKKIVTKS